MAVQHGVVEQLAGAVEHDGFAAGAEAGIDGEQAFLAERRGEQEFAQVFGEHADGGFVGALFRKQAGLGFHRWHEQALAAVLDGLGDVFAGRAGGFHPVGQGLGNDAVERHFDAHEQEAVLLAAADGEHAVGRDGFERLAPLEVVAELLRVGFLLLAIHDLGGNGGLFLVDLADAATQRGVVGHAFGDDVAGAGERVVGGGDFLFGVDELGGFVGGIGGLVFQKPVGERGEAALDRLGGAGLALRAERREDVLERGHRGARRRFSSSARA